MTYVLERLFSAADNHAEDAGEGDHAVGDLQSLLTAAWNKMSPSQRRSFIQCDAVNDVVEAGARGMFDAESLDVEIVRELASMETSAREAGYVIMQSSDGFHWMHDGNDEASENFPHREDAVADAYQDIGRGKGA